jgi:hypothetical protein
MKFSKEFFTEMCLVSLSFVKIGSVSHISLNGVIKFLPVGSMFLTDLGEFRYRATRNGVE